MANKRRFKIEIDGKDYTIIGESSAEHMRAVVHVIQEQLAEVKELVPGISDERAAILLAINAVSDQLKQQEKIDQLQQQLGKTDQEQQ